MKTITHVQHWPDHSSYYIMTEDGVGMVRVTDCGEELEISDLYVNEDCRRQGVGAQLMREAVTLCKTIHVHGKIIIETNHNSSAWVDEWYKRLGFIFERMQVPLPAILGDDDWSNVYSITF